MEIKAQNIVIEPIEKLLFAHKTQKNFRIKGEIWKSIAGYESRYLVSNFGRVISIKKYDINYGWKRCARFIKHSVHENRCIVVNLWKGDKFRTFRVHRLVASAFIENPENKPTVNHKDGNPKNNCLSNLEWATYSENNQHSYDNLDRKGAFEGRIGKMHPLSKRVGLLENGKIVKEFESARQAAIYYNLPINGVAKAARLGQKTGGMNWKYL